MASELEAATLDGAIPIFIGHVNVGGSISSTGQPQVGRELELDPALIARLDTVYNGLNHIHRHQEIAGAIYAGSICRQDFGENEPKGFIVVDATDVAASWQFIALEVPEQLLIEGRLTRDGFQFEHDDWMCGSCLGSGDDQEPGEGGPCPACLGRGRREWGGADIRVRYHYKKSETSALDSAHILAEFAGCRSLKLDPIAELEHSVRAPEVAAAVTLNAKVEAYCQRREIPWTHGLAAKLDALQQQPSETILASVTKVNEPAPAERAVA